MVIQMLSEGSGEGHGQECGEGASAMAEGELGFEVDFGHGAVECGQVEERVVAKAAGAAGRVEDEAFDRALGGVKRQAVPGGYQNAAVARGAGGGRDAGEALQQDHVVPHIGVVVGVGRVDQAGVGGEAGGADAGRAVEGIDFEAGVVCQHQHAGGEAGVVDGFERGVGGERGAIFFRGGNGGEGGQGIDFDGMRVCRGAEVAELALAGGGGVKAKGHGESVIAEASERVKE